MIKRKKTERERNEKRHLTSDTISPNLKSLLGASAVIDLNRIHRWFAVLRCPEHSACEAVQNVPACLMNHGDKGR
jgi:hypothetical protein